jgi:hypothetical protein
MDGVSCSLCHQIQDKTLGETSSFSGNPVFDMQTPMGERELFGRWIPLDPGSVMANTSGFVPVQGDHIVQSEICATCHNLYTNYVLKNDKWSEDLFPALTTYSEWLNSNLAAQTTCQGCHMPPADGEVVLANTGSDILRSPYAKHNFVGGNVFMLDVLSNFGGELGVQADTTQFDATISRTLEQLQTQTAKVDISEPTLEDKILKFDVTTNVLTGHKFPTGYPSRRAWLHVTVKDSSGTIVFESGEVGTDGAIKGNDNDTNPLAFEPHFDEINSPDQVQIYEGIMQDLNGDVTTVMMSATSYAKNNRLLPVGFDKTAVADDIAPDDLSLVDDDFIGGGDTVSFHLDMGGTSGVFTVEVELLYQSISFRWKDDLSNYNTNQAQLFSNYYKALPNIPVVVASQSAQSK